MDLTRKMLFINTTKLIRLPYKKIITGLITGSVVIFLSLCLVGIIVRFQRYFEKGYVVPFSTLKSITINDFYELYREEPSLLTSKNQDFLLVAGRIIPNESIELDEFSIVSKEESNSAQTGTYSMQVIDGRGNIVDSKPFDLNEGRYRLTVSYPPQAQVIKILQENRILKEIVISTQILRKAIDNIPNSKFNDDAAKTSEKLRSDINTIESGIYPKKIQISIKGGKQYGKEQYNAMALRNLRELKDKVEEMITDSDQTEERSHFTRDKLLQLIDNAIYHTRIDSIDPTFNTWDLCGDGSEPLYVYKYHSNLPATTLSPNGRYYLDIVKSQLFGTQFLKLTQTDNKKKVGRYYSSLLGLKVHCWTEDGSGLFVSDLTPGIGSLVYIFDHGDISSPVKKLLVP
jgi:hypothetical protein